ncbi:MAG TPA: DUF1990 domain-containing protein [Candidatus Nanopelagicales bacterium]
MTGEPLTYPDVGASTESVLPAGYRHVHEVITVGQGAASFERLAAALLSFDLHRAAGFRVDPAGTPVREGLEVTLGVAWSPLRPRCRVVYVVAEPTRRGFAYGTLPGHPDSGEEAFVASLEPSGEVRFARIAFTRPGPWWAKPFGWLIAVLQDRITARLVAAARSCA